MEVNRHFISYSVFFSFLNFFLFLGIFSFWLNFLCFLFFDFSFNGIKNFILALSHSFNFLGQIDLLLHRRIKFSGSSSVLKIDLVHSIGTSKSMICNILNSISVVFSALIVIGVVFWLGHKSNLYFYKSYWKINFSLKIINEFS